MPGNDNECHLHVGYLVIYFTCNVNMTPLSHLRHWQAANVSCICGETRSSRRLMTQVTNGQHAWMLVFVPVVELNIPCDCQLVFSILDELSVSHHAWCSG